MIRLSGLLALACYCLLIPSLAAQITFADPVNLSRSTAEVDVGDFDQDGNPDIFVCGGVQRWFAGPDFSTQYVLGSSTGGPYAAKVADFNGDGYPDVVTSDGARNAGDIPGFTYLYLNPGAGGDVFAEWPRITIYSGDVRHQNDLKVADLDGDGRLDVVTRSWSDQRVMLYFQNADINNWTARVLGDGMGNKEEGLSVGDVDGQPGLEIVLSGVYWKAADWRTVVIPSEYVINADFVGTVFGKVKSAIGDLDGDGDPDIYMGSAEGSTRYLAWHENTGVGPDGGVNYTTHVLDNFGDAHFAELADVDNDGDFDIWVGRAFSSTGIYLYRNDGIGNFTRSDIDANGQLYYGSIDDLDGDGDLDLVGPPQFYRNGINVYYNTSVLLPRAGAVTISPDGGTFVDPVTVTLTAELPYDDIRFTTDGTEPGDGSPVYTAPFLLSESTTVRAAAFGAGLLPSATATASFTVAVGGNFPPVADAGPDQVSSDLSPISLDGTGSSDADDGPTGISYAWSQRSGPSVSLTDADAAVAGFTPTETGTYRFRLTVSDEVDSDSDEVTVRITDLSAALIAYWPLDESAGPTAAELVAGNDATASGGALFQPMGGETNGAVAFDGSDGRLEAPAFDAAADALTISAWVNPASLNSVEGRIISKADGTVEADHYWMLSQNGGSALRFRLKTDGTTTTLISPTGLLTTNEWQLITATYDGAAMRLYRNATEIASVAVTGSVTAGPNVPVAIGNQPAGAGDRPFDGRIDEVRLYDVALSASEIANLAGGALPVRWGSVRAVPLDKQVRVEWSLLHQQDNRGFAIERFGEGRFRQIGYVPAGNQLQYAFLDSDPNAGENHYRLRQEDHDGTLDYSVTVSALLTESEPALYPNPTDGLITVTGLDDGRSPGYTILSAAGQVVRRGKLPVGGRLSVAELPVGWYRIRVGNQQLPFIRR